MTRATTSSRPVVLLLLLAVVVVAGACNGCSAMPSSSHSMNLCTYYEKHPTDECLPGGKWDPLSNACTGSSPGESCYSCYSGPWCDTYNNSTQACTAVLQGGNPLLFQEYWEQAATDGCTSVPASFKSGYQVWTLAELAVWVCVWSGAHKHCVWSEHGQLCSSGGRRERHSCTACCSWQCQHHWP